LKPIKSYSIPPPSGVLSDVSLFYLQKPLSLLSYLIIGMIAVLDPFAFDDAFSVLDHFWLDSN
jgi:hypothetical protein